MWDTTLSLLGRVNTLDVLALLTLGVMLFLAYREHPVTAWLSTFTWAFALGLALTIARKEPLGATLLAFSPSALALAIFLAVWVPLQVFFSVHYWQPNEAPLSLLLSSLAALTRMGILGLFMASLAFYWGGLQIDTRLWQDYIGYQTYHFADPAVLENSIYGRASMRALALVQDDVPIVASTLGIDK